MSVQRGQPHKNACGKSDKHLFSETPQSLRLQSQMPQITRLIADYEALSETANDSVGICNFFLNSSFTLCTDAHGSRVRSWLLCLSDDVVQVEIVDKQKHTGFLLHKQGPAFSLCFALVNY